MVEQLLDANPWLAALLVFVNNAAFIHVRTINIYHTTNVQIWKAMGSGVLIGVLWLVSTSIGVSAFLKGDILLVFAFLAGGATGTFTGMIKKHLKR